MLEGGVFQVLSDIKGLSYKKLLLNSTKSFKNQHKMLLTND